MVKQKVMNYVEKLYDENVNVRSEAVLALGEMRHVESVDVLLHVLVTDNELSVIEDTVWSLVRLGDVAVEPLIELLTHDHPSIRHNVAHTLGKIGDARAVDALITTLVDVDADVRNKAAFALGQIGDVKAIDALIDMLMDESLTVRVTAADVLEGFGADALPVLLPKMQDGKWHVRDRVADILGRIGDDSCVEPLLVALKDQMWEVRFTAIQGLHAIGDTRAIEPLRELLDDENAHVAKMADYVFSALNGK